MIMFLLIYLLTMIFILIDHYNFLKNDDELKNPTVKDLLSIHWTLYVPVINTSIVLGILIIDFLWKIFEKN